MTRPLSIPPASLEAISRRGMLLWGERIYTKLFYWNEVARGGHFAAFEQPEIFVAELRKSFAQFR
jgi:hypothetical protein